MNGLSFDDRELVAMAGLLSVIIPAYNEAERVQPAIIGIARWLRERAAAFEIIVVDDGSVDQTAQVVEQLAVDEPCLRLLRLPANQGKGAAVRAGMMAAGGRYVLFTDADQSTSIDQLPRVLGPLVLGRFDIAMGSRALRESSIVRGQAWYRQKLGVTFGLLAKLLLVRGFKDSQCGFKCFTQRAASRIFSPLTCRNGLFDMEVLLLAARSGFKVAEVPVVWRHDPVSRLVYNFRGSLGLVGELIRIRRQWRVVLPPKTDVVFGTGPISTPANAMAGIPAASPSDLT
jgi:dolichyl-phosphate beta-glucosyltransferase